MGVSIITQSSNLAPGGTYQKQQPRRSQTSAPNVLSVLFTQPRMEETQASTNGLVGKKNVVCTHNRKGRLCRGGRFVPTLKHRKALSGYRERERLISRKKTKNKKNTVNEARGDGCYKAHTRDLEAAGIRQLHSNGKMYMMERGQPKCGPHLQGFECRSDSQPWTPGSMRGLLLKEGGESPTPTFSSSRNDHKLLLLGFTLILIFCS